MVGSINQQQRQPPGAVLFIIRVMRWIVAAGGILSSLFVVMALVIISYSVFNRYFLGSPITWSDEVVGYLVAALALFGLGEGLIQKQHISIDLLTANASGKKRYFIDLWSNILVAGIAGILTWSAWETVHFSYIFGSYSIGYTEVPMWIVQSPLLVGGVLLMLAALSNLIRVLWGAEQ